ncbi:hypothetical protein WA158_007941 [Blastocystis sp. Blastoise]
MIAFMISIYNIKKSTQFTNPLSFTNNPLYSDQYHGVLSSNISHKTLTKFSKSSSDHSIYYYDSSSKESSWINQNNALNIIKKNYKKMSDSIHSKYQRPFEHLRQLLYFNKTQVHSNYELITLNTFPSSRYIQNISNYNSSIQFIPKIQSIYESYSIPLYPDYCDPTQLRNPSKTLFWRCTYKMIQHKLHVIQKNPKDILHSLKQKNHLPFSFIEDSIVYGQYIVLPPSGISYIDYEEYYHPYNPIQIYDSNTTIKYLYQQKETIERKRIDFYARDYYSNFFFFPVGTRFTFYILPRYDELKDLFDHYKLIYFLKSTYYNRDIRDGIRNTWGQYQHKYAFNFKIYFVVSKNSSDPLFSNIYKESEMYQDIIGTNIVEHYGNNTLKYFMIEELFIISNTTTTNVIIGDDDICVNPSEVDELLLRSRRKTYMGIIKNSSPDINLRDKWSKPYFILPWKIPFVDGPFTLYTKDILRKHIYTFPYMDNLFQNDDVFMSLLTLYNNIYPKHVLKHFNEADIIYKNKITIKQSKLLYTHHTNKTHFYSICR